MRVLARLILSVSFFVSMQAALAETYTGRVVGIADGDTITVLDASNTPHKIRLSGIDAPEKKQAFGNFSKQKLAELIFSKTVSVETTRKDRYKREIGKVWLGSIDTNLEQVRAGLAWHYKKYEHDACRPSGVCVG